MEVRTSNSTSRSCCRFVCSKKAMTKSQLKYNRKLQDSHGNRSERQNKRCKITDKNRKRHATDFLFSRYLITLAFVRSLSGIFSHTLQSFKLCQTVLKPLSFQTLVGFKIMSRLNHSVRLKVQDVRWEAVWKEMWQQFWESHSSHHEMKDSWEENRKKNLWRNVEEPFFGSRNKRAVMCDMK